MSPSSTSCSRTFARVAVGIAIATALTASRPLVAAPAAQLATFEVASVRKALTTRERGISFLPGGQFRATGASLRDLIRRAWNLQSDQIVGDRDWMSTELYDITARASGAATEAQMLPMVKALLADRFRLRVHEEMRDLAVYRLVRASGNRPLGERLRRSTTDCDAFRRGIAEARRQGGGAPAAMPTARCGFGARTVGVLTTLDIGAATMPQLASYLTPFAGRMVLDRTGLEGRFDVELDVNAAALRRLAGRPESGGPAAGADEPSLFTSVQEQLGLKLEPVKAPVSVLVIDAASPATPN